MNKLKAFFKVVNQEGREESKKCLNPYLNARRAWSTHTAGLMKSLQLWQCIAIGSLLITISAVGGLISVASQSKFIPLVFQQDTSGNTLSITRADSVGQATIEDFRLAAANFIENIRTVSMDSELQRKSVFQVFSYLSPNTPATKKVQEFYNNSQSNPFSRASDELVNITIKTVIKETQDTWQVDWVETIRTTNGEIKEQSKPMKALLTLEQQENSKDMENTSLLKNPHLIVIKDFNWSTELQKGENA